MLRGEERDLALSNVVALASSPVNFEFLRVAWSVLFLLSILLFCLLKTVAAEIVFFTLASDIFFAGRSTLPRILRAGSVRSTPILSGIDQVRMTYCMCREVRSRAWK